MSKGSKFISFSQAFVLSNAYFLTELAQSQDVQPSSQQLLSLEHFFLGYATYCSDKAEK
jgi:hypothetical protein